MKKLILIGGSLFVLWELLKDKGEDDSAKKKNRKIQFFRNDAINGLGSITSNGSAILIPAVSESFYKTADLPKIKNILAKIGNAFSSEIFQSERLTNVPAPLITAYIFAESGGKKEVVSGSGAVGLMQLIPISASSVIHLENKKKRLSDEEKTIIAKHIGTERLSKILKAVNLSKITASMITKKDLMIPELNILIGSIFLGLLIDEHNESGKIRLDKVTLRYNKGYFFKPKGATEQETLALAKKMSSETSAYIIKITGKNGLLEIQQT